MPFDRSADWSGSALEAGPSAEQDWGRELELIYRRHRDDVYRIAVRYGGGRREWAEDLVQDVFIALAGALPGLQDRDLLMGWLYRVTTRRCLNRLQYERVRALAPLAWVAERWSAAPPRPDAIVATRCEADRALALLSSLPPKERVAFSMYHLDERSVEEIGQTLGHTKGYVSKLIQRAETRLREALA